MIQGIKITEVDGYFSVFRNWVSAGDKLIFFTEGKVFKVENDGSLSLLKEHTNQTLDMNSADYQKWNCIEAGSSISHDWVFFCWSQGGLTSPDIRVAFMGVNKLSGELRNLGGSPGVPGGFDSEIQEPFGPWADPFHYLNGNPMPLWDPENSVVWVFQAVYKITYSGQIDPDQIAQVAVFKVPWDPSTMTAGPIELVSKIDCYSYSLATPNKIKIDCHPIKMGDKIIVCATSGANLSLDPETSDRPGSFLIVCDSNTGLPLDIVELSSEPLLSGATALFALDENSIIVTYREYPHYSVTAPPINHEQVSFDSYAKTFSWDGDYLTERDSKAIPIFHPLSFDRVRTGNFNSSTDAFVGRYDSDRHGDPLEIVGSNDSGRMIQFITADYKGPWFPQLGISEACRLIWWDWSVDDSLNITLGSRNVISLRDEIDYDFSFNDFSLVTVAYRWFRQQMPKGFLVTSYADSSASKRSMTLVDPMSLN